MYTYIKLQLTANKHARVVPPALELKTFINSMVIDAKIFKRVGLASNLTKTNAAYICVRAKADHCFFMCSLGLSCLNCTAS